MALFRKNTEQQNNGRDLRAKEILASSSVIPPAMSPGNPEHVNGNGSAHANAQANNNPVVTNGGYTPPPEFRKVREEVQQFLVNDVKSVNDVGGPAKLRQLVEPVFNRAIENANLVISRVERARLMDMLLADIL